MRTYKVTDDYVNFLNLDVNLKEVLLSVGKRMGGIKKFSTYGADNASLVRVWGQQRGRFTAVAGLPGTEAPDITKWNGANLVLAPNAYQALKASLQPYGEFLPIAIDGKIYFVFNCMNLVDANEKQSENDVVDGLWMGITRIGFRNRDVTENLLFKTPFDRCSAIYCGEEFKSLVESNGFRGLAFSRDLTD